MLLWQTLDCLKSSRIRLLGLTSQITSRGRLGTCLPNVGEGSVRILSQLSPSIDSFTGVKQSIRCLRLGYDVGNLTFACNSRLTLNQIYCQCPRDIHRTTSLWLHQRRRYHLSPCCPRKPTSRPTRAGAWPPTWTYGRYLVLDH